MKKVFAFAAMAAAMVFAANTVSAQLGINIGYAPQTLKADKVAFAAGPSSLDSTMNMSGFFVGVNYNINITGDLGVSIGVQGRYNTQSDESKVASATLKMSNTQMLVDVPILFNYGLNLTDDLGLSVFVGPTISYAINGKTEFTNSVTSSLNWESDWYDEDAGNMSHFDLSGTLGVCLSYDGIRLYGGFNKGFLDLAKDDNLKVTGSNWFIGVGYAL